MTEPFIPDESPGDGSHPSYGTVRTTRSPRIRPIDVDQAADALLLEGHRPTIDRIRMRLGRGSPNTIQEHLDLWWTKLGGRLRDIPGREIPGVPEDVAGALLGLWNTAIDSAHVSLGERAIAREADLAERESTLAQRELALAERERASAALESSLDEALTLARDQLASVNERAERLESLLEARDAEFARIRSSAEAAAEDARTVRAQLDFAVSAHRAERDKQDERHAVSESRWMVEVDRARQVVKDVSRDHEKQVKELRGLLGQVQAQRDEFKREAKDTGTELRAAAKANSDLEKRIASLAAAASKRAAAPNTTGKTARASVQGRKRVPAKVSKRAIRH